MKNWGFYHSGLKYIGAFYLFFLAIGCEIATDIKEPTHFDIRNMNCFLTDNPEEYSGYSGAFLGLNFLQEIYIFTPKKAFFNNSGQNLYATHSYGRFFHYIPTEEIEKIYIIAHAYNNTYHSGDTINHITNIKQILDSIDYQAQHKIIISFLEPHTDPRELRVEYYQTNGEKYICEIRDP